MSSKKSYKQLIGEATELGREAGNDAASWYYNRTDPSRDDLLKVLKGIEDGDPEILDTFASSPLSGEHADSPTPQTLYDMLGMGSGRVEFVGDEVCEAFEQAFSTAYESNVVEQTRERLRTNYTFTLDLELVEQDPQKVLSALVDKAAEMNCDLIEESVSEEGEIIA